MSEATNNANGKEKDDRDDDYDSNSDKGNASLPSSSVNNHRFRQYPEVVSFVGVGRASLKQIHIIALSLIAVGVLFAYYAPPGGYVLLMIFILIAAGYDMIFIRKSQRPVRVSLYLRTDPVEAMYGEKKIGEIRNGTIRTEMESLNELGYRPAPNRDLMVWTFDSQKDAEIVSKRLLEYLQRD